MRMWSTTHIRTHLACEPHARGRRNRCAVRDVNLGGVEVTALGARDGVEVAAAPNCMVGQGGRERKTSQSGKGLSVSEEGRPG